MNSESALRRWQRTGTQEDLHAWFKACKQAEAIRELRQDALRVKLAHAEAARREAGAKYLASLDHASMQVMIHTELALRCLHRQANLLVDRPLGNINDGLHPSIG